MNLKNINFVLLTILLSACDMTGSDLNNAVNSEKKGSIYMSNEENRLSYLDAKKLSTGFLSAELSEQNQKNILELENKSKEPREINAQFVLSLMNFYNGSSNEKKDALKVFFKLAELGHPYAALEFVKYSKSDVNNFNTVKKITNLTTEQLNNKNNKFINLAIKHNINAAYYYYAEYLSDGLNQGAKFNESVFQSFDQQKNILEHLFLNTSSYLGNVPDLNVFLIYSNLYLNNELQSGDIVKAKALVIYFKKIKSVYSDEKFSSEYLALERNLGEIDKKYYSIDDNNKDLKEYIDKIKNTPKVFISDWIEKEVDYK